jgi:hypothetical protein
MQGNANLYYKKQIPKLKKITTMTRIEIEQSLKDLNQMVISGKLLEAFEKYYHEDISMQENNLPPVVSKETNRQREVEFVNNLTAFRKAEVQGMAVGDDISFVIWHYDYAHKQWGEKQYTQVSVQHWKDGKIIAEKFIYN